MSLIAWYPLNKDLKNYGISDSSDMARQEGIMSIKENGKLGKYVNFNCSVSGGTEKNNITTSLLTSDNMRNLSISFWLYVGTGSHNRFADIINFETPNSTNVRMTLEFDSISSGSFVLRWFGGRAKDASGYCPTNNLLYNTWYHITTVYDETDVKLYINGNLVSTYIFDSSNITKLSGNWHLGDATTLCENIGFNDVRIYDHSLSKTEIKEIAKGLVVHYPLNSGYGNENLLVNSYNGCNVSYTSSTILDETYYGFKIRYLKYEGTSYQDTIQVLNVVTPKPDTYYTASFWAKGNCVINNYFFPNNCASGISSDGHTTTSVDGNCYISLTPEWKRYWITWKTRNDVSGAKNIVVGRIQNKGTGAECYIAELKFEEGDKNSVWSPNEADDLYSILGYDSTTIYDTSGLGNNVEKINTPIYTSDTALYDSCINFNQSGYLKNTSLNLYANKLTICFWVKISDTISSQHFLFSTHNNWTKNGVAMWRDNSTQKGYYLLIRSNTETTFSRPFIGIDVDTWTFISISYAGEQYSVYKNGSLYQTVDYGNNGQVYNPVLYLGNSLYNESPSTETDESLMSDFRIYSTALSAEDIKQLYESKARVDKNGNVYCNEFVEEIKKEIDISNKMTLEYTKCGTVQQLTGNSFHTSKTSTDKNGTGKGFISSTFTVGKSYRLSYSFKKTDGELHSMGGHNDVGNIVARYIDGISVGNSYSAPRDNSTIIDNKDLHYHEIYFTVTSKTGNIYIQPNRGFADALCEVDIYDVVLEEVRDINNIKKKVVVEKTGVLNGQQLIESPLYQKSFFGATGVATTNEIIEI